jgi:hypothetical protein
VEGEHLTVYIIIYSKTPLVMDIITVTELVHCPGKIARVTDRTPLPVVIAILESVAAAALPFDQDFIDSPR